MRTRKVGVKPSRSDTPRPSSSAARPSESFARTLPARWLLGALGGLAFATHLWAQGTAITYQGRLNENSRPASGLFDLRLGIHDLAEGGSPVTEPETILDVGVTNGIFSVLLHVHPAALNGTERWLDIAVRPAGGGTFSPLEPRQRITPTPYALTALNVPGVDGHALHAASGGPTNAVFVDGAGSVGIGTTSPGSKLHVVSGASENSPPRLESSSTGAFNAGLDFYHGAIGKGYVGVPDSAAVFAPGEMLLFGAPGTKVTLWPGGARSLTADPAGNVGIGTPEPRAKLDVRGDVMLGPNGEFHAASGEENLRIIRGKVTAFANIVAGAGFQVTRESEGRYIITFNTPFTALPVVTCTADRSAGIILLYMVGEVNARSAKVLVWHSTTQEPRDADFHFIAIGPR